MRDADASTPRRPRPVPDAPTAPFALGTGLAKAWLLELVDAAPLDQVGQLPTAALAREAPALCAAICRALADDAALDRLARGGADAPMAARVASLAGVTGPAGTVRALEALRSVAFAALRAELPRRDTSLLPDLADRLAHVCGVVAATACEDADAGSLDAVRSTHDLVEPHDTVVLRDVRDRSDEDAAWHDRLARRLERYGRDERPFALLLVEIDDFPTLLRAHDAEELAVAVQAFQRALADVATPGEVLAREEDGRHWLTLGDADASLARDVAAEIAATVRETATLRGVGVAVSIGVAACPGDGVELTPLEACADERLFLARAAGVPVSG